MHLPDIDGFEVSQRIASLPDGQDGQPAVVLVSSRDGADFGPLVERSGARGFVAKDELSGSTLAELIQ